MRLSETVTKSGVTVDATCVGVAQSLGAEHRIHVASGAKTGAVTPIQRFGSALNRNIHFHMLFLDGAYRFDRARPRFHRAPRPTPAEFVRLLHTISTRVARLLER